MLLIHYNIPFLLNRSPLQGFNGFTITCYKQKAPNGANVMPHRGTLFVELINDNKIKPCKGDLSYY